MEVFIGIDPGLTGGIAILDTSKQIVKMMPMPLIDGEFDHITIAKIFKEWMFEYEVKLVVIEALSTRPGQDASRVMKYSKNFGILIGILESIGSNYIEVRPQTWMKTFEPIDGENLTPTKRRTLIKRRNAVIAKKLFKGESFSIGIRSKKAHEGIVDAVLLANHGFNTWLDRKQIGDSHIKESRVANLFAMKVKPYRIKTN